MKKLAIFVLALCLVFPLFPAHAAEPTFTLMVYLCGTDLETDGGSATDDLLEMIDSGIAADGPVHVLVETGGTYEWWVDNIEADASERWVVGDGTAYCLQSAPRADMGTPQTLTDFVQWGIDAYPADRYGLILWNHGGGSAMGVCYDEWTDNYLTCEDVHNALQAVRDGDPGFQLDFIGFDACLMATFEMASYVRDFADYMIASEELAPSGGFDYTALVGALADNPGIDIPRLGRTIVDSYFAAALSQYADDYLTLSVLDLSAMQSLIDELEALGGGLHAALNAGNLRTISRERQDMRSLGDYEDSGSDMVDLRQFITTYAGVSGVGASRALAALDDVILYNRYTEENLDAMCGMSILVPLKTREDFDAYLPYYDAMDQYPQYTRFIQDYTEMLNGGSYVFSSTTPRATSGWGLLASLGDDVSITGSTAGFEGLVSQIDEAAEADADGYDDADILAYSLDLTEEDMEHLAFIEGNLMIDISDDETEAYIDLGYLQNAVIDWENHRVHSLFDGTWPALEGQLVHMTDQVVTAVSRRSLIDAWVNDMDVYLLVVFDEKRPQGEVIGYTEGYTASGMPARGYTRLSPGDIITPQYYLYMYEDGEEYIDSFLGDPITYTGAPLSFAYEDLGGEDTNFAYTFCLNDIFGDYSFSDFLLFSL